MIRIVGSHAKNNMEAYNSSGRKVTLFSANQNALFLRKHHKIWCRITLFWWNIGFSGLANFQQNLLHWILNCVTIARQINSGPAEDEGYWGVPPWVKHKMEPPEHLFPWPLKEPRVWDCGYFTEEISHGFGQFYDNVNGVADDFANFWGILARRLRSFYFKMRPLW